MVKTAGAAQPGMAEPSCITTRRTLPPWTCSLFKLSVFDLLYVFVIVRLGRRTSSDQRHSKSHGRMVARQITEAFPWDEAPH